jgi:hypothetical protein
MLDPFMAGIFISYRREGSAGYAGRLAERLREVFGSDRIFRDVEAIEPGVDFVEAIDHAVGSCDVLLALIGPQWLKFSDDSGRPRLEDPSDFVRLEIEAALQRDVRLIPVLVGGASMPSAQELPESLEKLARRQFFELSDRRWDYDVEQLVTGLAKVPGLAAAGRKKAAGGRGEALPQATRRPWKWFTGAAVLALLAALVVGFYPLQEPLPEVREATGTPDPAQGAQSESGLLEGYVQESMYEDADTVDASQNGGFEGLPSSALQQAPSSLSGLWIDDQGIFYRVQQNGSQITFCELQTCLAGELDARGTISGDVIEIKFGDPPDIVLKGVMSVAPDLQSMEGELTDTLDGSREQFYLERSILGEGEGPDLDTDAINAIRNIRS